MALPAWHEVNERLDALGAPCAAAEAHGLLCGLLALAVPSARDVWLERAVGGKQAPAPLDALCDETARELDDVELGLELLLPGDDEADLGERTEALAQWCAGFASGAGLAGRRAADLPAESREFLEDVTRIAQAEVASDEDDEAAFAEVVEYVRMGVLLTRTECAGQGAAG